jgi:acetyltransferase-like isoleucine patch superfamily enzyme
MSIVGKICGSLEARLNQPRLRILRTIYFNFRTLPFSQAIKLPIYIYGKVRLYMLNGSIEFRNTEIKSGMVKIGVNADSFNLFDGSGFISLTASNSKIIFNGPARIALNTEIRVVADGVLTIGKNSRIGSGASVICNGGRVEIGDFTGITWGCVVMNSSFHNVYDSNKGGYVKPTRDIHIGSFCWIGNRSTIYAGAYIPDYTISTATSYINKNFKEYEGSRITLAGSPAKKIGEGVSRVFSPQLELELYNWFQSNPEQQIRLCDEMKDNYEDINVEM